MRAGEEGVHAQRRRAVEARADLPEMAACGQLEAIEHCRRGPRDEQPSDLHAHSVHGLTKGQLWSSHYYGRWLYRLWRPEACRPDFWLW